MHVSSSSSTSASHSSYSHFSQRGGNRNRGRDSRDGRDRDRPDAPPHGGGGGGGGGRGGSDRNPCNNCGKKGHLFYQCKLPITSCGIILFQHGKNGVEYLMIRRKDSFGYIDFMRGKYSLQHVEKIRQLIAEMSTEEQQRLLNHSFSDLWLQLWGNTSTNPQHCMEEVSSEKKFNQLLHGFRLNGEWVQLKQLVENAPQHWTETEWEFPKGRRVTHEKDLDCALREFEEETGIAKHQIAVIENVLPFEEIFIGSNYKAYKHKYFLAKRAPVPAAEPENETDMSRFQTAEVSAMEWKTYDECMRLIRPYHIEKKKMIDNIHNLLTTHRVVEDHELH